MEQSAETAKMQQASDSREEKPVVRISVRRMVVFILRSGDLDNRSQRGSDLEAALAGSRLHRKLQKAAKGDYEAEVVLLEDVEYDDVIIRIEGRADGIIDRHTDRPIIEEIKGMYIDLALLEEPFPLHLAQARCYAAMLAEEEELSEVGIRMTYADLDSEEIRHFDSSYNKEELRTWFLEVVTSYHRFVSWQLAHIRARNRSMQDLNFPFPYREGQRKLTAAVYRSIEAGEELFLMAPTGVGKTMSCVFPAVRAMGQGFGERIFYLTAKNETLSVGEEAFSILDRKGLDFRTVRITSKEKICPRTEVNCNPESCPYARGHFDRINDAVLDLLTSKTHYDSGTLLRQAEERNVCPFELTLDVSSWCDAILCDYNYVFDPDARLQRFFGQGVKSEAIFLADEVHNLVDRGREMYSAVLVKEHVLSMKRVLAPGKEQKPEGDAKKAVLAAERLNKILLTLKHETEEAPTGITMETPYRIWEYNELDRLFASAQSLYEALQRYFQNSRDTAKKDRLTDAFFEIRSFCNTIDYVDENYRVYTELTEEGFGVRLFCANPAARLTSCIDRGRAAVFFSATLLPIQYYKKTLSTREELKAVYAPSPFDRSHRLLLAAGDVSTRYAARSTELYRRIASYIAKTAQAKTGNYLVFFPSYKMLRDVFRVYRDEFDTDAVNWVVQSSGMQEDDREIFLENFYEEPEKSLVGFCVMGGVFSEGIDLTGTRLIGAVVVGAGLPQVSNEREILKHFFDQENCGFDYAYRYPGMNKVEQAAGRVIRTAEDRGVILLLDSRLAEPSYRRLYPAEWSDCEVCYLENVSEHLEAFWGHPEGESSS
ncbi:MAG: ATP-dependent DNA helicase [Lachnospiraceae bacterium]|nr:ATP-dependent DNA helicase [Lachnospiraceae bacterium]